VRGFHSRWRALSDALQTAHIASAAMVVLRHEVGRPLLHLTSCLWDFCQMARSALRWGAAGPEPERNPPLWRSRVSAAAFMLRRARDTLWITFH
jgi:hypothetical protein